ncbi:neuronal PAS domain-containing protein 4B-like [Amazona ochrocephala]
MLSLSLPNGWLCRSTKSASKARRDQINVELQALRSLLPISAREKERLSYLHTMALVCLQLRGAQLFPPGTHSTTAPHMSLALCGALFHTLSDGKLVYISENVAQVLGLSVVELLAHGDVVFDILDQQAHEDVREKLLLAQEEPGREVTFVCEMRTSKAFQLQHGGNRAVVVHGRFTALRWPPSRSTTAFLALCTPLPMPRRGEAAHTRAIAARLPSAALCVRLSDTARASSLPCSHLCSPVVLLSPPILPQLLLADMVQTLHSVPLPLVFPSVTYHLGYHREELRGQSWYSLLHPEDADLAASQHRAVGECQGWEHVFSCGYA